MPTIIISQIIITRMKRAIINNATLAYFILKICELILVVAKKSLKKIFAKNGRAELLKNRTGHVEQEKFRL